MSLEVFKGDNEPFLIEEGFVEVVGLILWILAESSLKSVRCKFEVLKAAFKFSKLIDFIEGKGEAFLREEFRELRIKRQIVITRKVTKHVVDLLFKKSICDEALLSEANLAVPGVS